MSNKGASLHFIGTYVNVDRIGLLIINHGGICVAAALTHISLACVSGQR